MHALAVPLALLMSSHVASHVATPAPVLAARVAEAETFELRRRPVAGERIVQAFVLDHALVAQSLTLRLGSDEQRSQDEIEVGGRTSLRFADEIRAVEGARVTLLRRVVEEASVQVDMRQKPPSGPTRTMTLDGGSPLAGAGVGVLHRWIPARATYGKLYDAVETSEEFLPRLPTTLDLGWLLPDAAVAVGARWTIEPARLGETFAYGGLVPIRFAKGADPLLARTTSLGVGGPLYEVFGGETTGTVEAELAAVEGGVARIVLRVDVRAKKDQSAISRQKLTPTELLAGRSVERAEVEWSFRGEGQLRWNVAAGRAESLSLTGAERVEVSLSLNGPDGTSGSDLALAGSLKLSIDVASGAKPTGPKPPESKDAAPR